jgi:peptidoglycan hydrolase CwlO-like protein
MFQTLAKFEVIIENKVYHFLCDPNSSIDHVKEALFQVQKAVATLEDQIKSAQEKAKKDQEEANPSQEIVSGELPSQDNSEVLNEQ